MLSPMAVASVPEGSPVRERLARTALRLFAQRGYNGVSNREIVEACGLTKGAIYWYFESKEHLFRTVIAEALTGWERRVATAMAGAQTWDEQLASIFRVFVEVLEDPDDPHRDLMILMAHNLPGGPGQDALGHASQQRFVGWVESVLNEYDAGAGGRDVAALVHTAGLGVLVHAAAGHPEMARPVLGALLRLLGGAELYPGGSGRA